MSFTHFPTATPSAQQMVPLGQLVGVQGSAQVPLRQLPEQQSLLPVQASPFGWPQANPTRAAEAASGMHTLSRDARPRITAAVRTRRRRADTIAVDAGDAGQALAISTGTAIDATRRIAGRVTGAVLVATARDNTPTPPHSAYNWCCSPPSDRRHWRCSSLSRWRDRRPDTGLMGCRDFGWHRRRRRTSRRTRPGRTDWRCSAGRSCTARSDSSTSTRGSSRTAPRPCRRPAR